MARTSGRGRWTGKDTGEGHHGPIPIEHVESETVRGIRKMTEPQSRMPKGARLSPIGDIGELRQREALAVFPSLKKMTQHVKRASKQIHVPKGML